MTVRKLVAACVAMLVLSGCAVRQDIRPVQIAPSTARSICIIEHPATRTTFREAYQRALQNKGFAVQIIPEGSSYSACPLTTTYIARWSWDLTIYMSYAEIRVFQDGRDAGSALYDARMGGGRLDKWIDAEAKVIEMVGQLFP